MMKKKTVRLISCVIAGILVAAMVFSIDRLRAWFMPAR